MRKLEFGWENCCLLCSWILSIQKVYKMLFFLYYFNPHRKLTKKTLLHGPNSLHDYRGSNHQGGFHRSWLLSYDYHLVLMFWVLWLNICVIKLPTVPSALLIQLQAVSIEVTHTISTGDGLIKCRILCTRQESMLEQNDLLFLWLMKSASEDTQRRRKSLRMAHMTHCSSSAVSFDCALSPCRRHPPENNALI